MLERLEAIPAIAGAAVTTAPPLTWKGGFNGLSIDGQPPQAGHSALHRQVSTNYFTVMGIPLRAGRLFDAGDGAWMSSLLFEVSPTDVVTFASVAALLASVALAACCVPATRAMKADLVGLLR